MGLTNYIIEDKTGIKVTDVKQLVDGNIYRCRLEIAELNLVESDSRNTDKLMVKLKAYGLYNMDNLEFNYVMAFDVNRVQALRNIKDFSFKRRLNIKKGSTDCITQYNFIGL